MIGFKSVVSGLLALIVLFLIVAVFPQEIKKAGAKILGYDIEEEYYGLDKTTYYAEMQELHATPVKSVNALVCGINTVTTSLLLKVEGKELYKGCEEYAPVLKCGDLSTVDSKKLDSSKEAAIKQISEASISCWKKFNAVQKRSTFCTKFDASMLSASISEEDILEKLGRSGT